MRWLPRTVPAAAVVAVLAAVPALAGVASAHGGGTRFDAPLPLPLLFAGAGATVLATAALLADAGARPERTAVRRVASVPPTVAAAARTAGRWLFFAAFAGALAAGAAGPQTADNVAVLFVWPVLLKGVGLAAAIAGSPWRVLSPWRTAYEALARLEGREVAVLGGYPLRLGAWPALVGFAVVVGVVENLTAVPRLPRLTAAVFAVYAAVMVLGGVAFGREWFRRADAFAVLFDLFGRVAPLRVDRADDGGYAVSLRPPWRGCVRPVDGLATTAFAVAAVYTVSFDGFTGTPEYTAVARAVGGAVGLGPVVGVPLYLLGFLGFLAAFEIAARATDRPLAADGGNDGERTSEGVGAARAFAPTVLPIAVAYEVAHNYPYVLGSLGRLAGRLAGAGAADPLAWLPLPVFWGSQVALVVAGHVAAVVAAHLVVVRRAADPGTARRAHLPTTLLMVGYTVLSLWIVSRPVVSG